ncbi:MAG: phosphate signaling complex protein PhoU [Desulfocapsaceae bacterium]|jgi:phosphate transport system protein
MEPFYTFHIELNKLNKKLLHMSAQVEDRVRRATSLIHNYDDQVARSLVLSDYEIDELEIGIEEDCLKILALHQPVAGDLRFIVTVIKVNNELERIADFAVNIAQRAQAINNSQSKQYIAGINFSTMSEKVITMLKYSLDALINRDARLARKVFLMDDDVDEYRNQVYHTIKDIIRKHPEHPGGLINTYLLARHLERMADRATNISEEAIYLVEGIVTRANA